MNILLETIEKLPETEALKQAIAQSRLPCSLARVAAGARQHLAKGISGGRDVLFVCATEYEARQRFSEYIYGNKILLPAPQTELRPVETRGEELAGERIRALCQMQKGGSVVFLSMDSLLFSMRPAAEFYGRFLCLAPGTVFPPEKLAEALVALGYEGCAMVEGPGQVSGRGEIMEVFPPDAKAPYRITFSTTKLRASAPSIRIPSARSARGKRRSASRRRRSSAWMGRPGRRWSTISPGTAARA